MGCYQGIVSSKNITMAKDNNFYGKKKKKSPPPQSQPIIISISFLCIILQYCHLNLQVHFQYTG